MARSTSPPSHVDFCISIPPTTTLGAQHTSGLHISTTYKQVQTACRQDIQATRNHDTDTGIAISCLGFMGKATHTRKTRSISTTSERYGHMKTTHSR
eukprot:183727-Rhodomonas_salina.1